MTIKRILHCPNCQSTKIKKNGKKSYKSKIIYVKLAEDNLLVTDHALSYQGCCSGIKKEILKTLVRGVGIMYVPDIEEININKGLSILVNSDKIITPKQQHYDCLEVDEFWTYMAIKRIRFG